jgi:hypothetical protein
MTFFESLLTWANLPFTAAVATVGVYATLQLTGVLGLFSGGDTDHDADAEGDHDADVSHELEGDASGDHDVGAESDSGSDHEADGDHDAEGEQEAQGESSGRGAAIHADGVLAGLGLGQVPMSMIWQAFALSFGLLGIVTNSLVYMGTGHLPALTLALSLPVSLTGGYGITRGITRAILKLATVQEAASHRDLIGLPGVVVTGQVDHEFGEVRVKLPDGNFVQVHCRVIDGEKPILQHEPVVIVDYDRSQDRIYVTRVETGAAEALPASDGAVARKDGRHVS